MPSGLRVYVEATRLGSLAVVRSERKLKHLAVCGDLVSCVVTAMRCQ